MDSCLEEPGWKMTTHENKAAVARWQGTARRIWELRSGAAEWIHTRFWSPCSLHKSMLPPVGRIWIYTHNTETLRTFPGLYSNNPSGIRGTEQSARKKVSREAFKKEVSFQLVLEDRREVLAYGWLSEDRVSDERTHTPSCQDSEAEMGSHWSISKQCPWLRMKEVVSV